eukprot:1194280-Prorocentrum_minimum.AAC.10
MPMPNFRAVNMLAPVPVKAANVVAPARGALCGTPVQRPMVVACVRVRGRAKREVEEPKRRLTYE